MTGVVVLDLCSSFVVAGLVVRLWVWAKQIVTG